MPPSVVQHDAMDTATDALPSSAKDNTPSKVKRVNKACLNCRQRKSKCHLNEDGSVPCQRCKKEGLECILGGSNRGGRRIRRKTFENRTRNERSRFTPEPNGAFGVGTVATVTGWGQGDNALDSPANSRTSRPSLHDSASNDGHMVRELPRPETESSAPLTPEGGGIPFSNLQNPSDALGILAQVAESNSEEGASGQVHQVSLSQNDAERATARATSGAGLNFPPVDEGKVTITQVDLLVRRYHEFYHPHYPLCPPKMFDSARLVENITQEPILTTAVLVVSSKDLIDQPSLYDTCASHMRRLVGDLAAGGDSTLGAVEALLIMAEWAPYTQRSKSGNVGRGEEDKESWMHVGLALRVAYFLGLDKYSFRVPDDDNDPQLHRKVLIWTACFISDRNISIRIGKAFWSRGPGPLTSFRRDDWPYLQPSNPTDEDYASIFQATLELTLVFTNVHDVLYSSPGSSFRTHLSGGYFKFIDDFRSAIYGWKSVWGTLTCSPHLKAVLLMSYDYLRLYTNAFAFQATIRRLLKWKHNPSDPAEYQAPSRIFHNNVAAVPDVRFIYEGLDAAKAILSTANNFVDPEGMLRFMPLRIYLYLVYAGVFLYRARCVGVMAPDEDGAIRKMIQETISRLQRSSVGPLHPGARYAQLLRLLWNKLPSKDRNQVGNILPLNTLGRPVGTPTSMGSQAGSAGRVGASPASAEPMPDFAWTDLMAVGEFAMGNGGSVMNGHMGEDSAFWSGFLPFDLGNNAWDMGQYNAGQVGLNF